MNYIRIVLSAAAAMVAFFTYGFLVHGLLIAKDYVSYPEGVYRSGDTARSLIPVGLTGLFVAMLVFAIIYAKGYERGHGPGPGSRQGLLFGIFMAGAFVAVTTRLSTSAESWRWSWRLANWSNGRSSAWWSARSTSPQRLQHIDDSTAEPGGTTC